MDKPLSNDGQRSSPAREWVERDHHDDSASEPRSSPPPKWRSNERPPETLTLDHSRSLSSHHYTSDNSGYHSSGALSDGAPNSATGHASSMRSVGSTGSEERYAHRSFFRASHIMNSETRFPTAMSYATSEAAKSDIATVCSGSVVDDIDVASVLSAEMNVPQTPTSERISSLGGTLNPGGGSSLRRSNSGSIGTPRSVEFAPSLGLSAGNMHPRPQQVPLMPLPNARASPTLRPTLAIPMNDMGPPLSRSLLLQQHQPGERSFGGSSSRAGSVRSFGSQRSVASSDVVAHVDTDDCGGSLAESVECHSIHSSQADPVEDEEKKNDNVSEQDKAMSNPLIQADASSSQTNGRTSPGGTVYKGRGVRRYQGRYMNLPLKRFHQNGVSIGGDSAGYVRNGFLYDDDPPHDRSSSPQWGRENGRRDRSRSRSRSPHRRENGYHRERSWSPHRFTRSNSRSPPSRGGRPNGRRKSWGQGENGRTSSPPRSYRRTRGRGSNGWSNDGESKATNGRSSYRSGSRKRSSNRRSKSRS